MRLYGWHWSRAVDGVERAGSAREMNVAEAESLGQAGHDVRPATWADRTAVLDEDDEED